MSDAGPDPQPDGSAPAIGTVLDGRYELIAPIGEGGVGWVFRARDVRLGTDVAIKMLQAHYAEHESLRPRFEREAQALAQLRHPHIVTMTDYSVAGGRPFLVMERLEGRTLAELLASGPLPEERARRILRQVLDALIYAHGRGFAHRDLKPSNIFLVELPTDPDHVKILDFGFVKLMHGEDGERSALTVSGIAFGTPSYMCPEQATGAPTDPRADLYSAGVVMYEMLSGERPFVGEIPEVIRAHLTQPVPRLTVGALTAGRELRAFLERALAKAPIDRFQSAAEMREALDRLPTPALVPLAEVHALEHAETVPPPPPPRAAKPAVPPPPPPAARAAPPARRRPIGLAIAMTLLVVGGSAALYLAARERSWRGSTTPAAEPAGAAADPPSRVALVTAPPEEREPAPVPEEPAGPAAGDEEVAELAPSEPLEVASVEGAPVDDPAEPPSEPVAEADAPTAEGAALDEAQEAAQEEEAVAPVELRDPWTTREPVPLLDHARRVLSRGRPLSEAGERRMREYVREHRSDPRPHLILAQHYLERGVDRGAYERYALAERVDPAARLDPRMLPDLVRLASRESMAREAADLIERLYGRDAIAEVDRALASEGLSAQARARLQALRARLGSIELSP